MTSPDLLVLLGLACYVVGACGVLWLTFFYGGDDR